MLFVPTALGFVCNSILCRWQQEVWCWCIRFSLCGTRDYISGCYQYFEMKWGLNSVFSHPYLTLNSPCRLYLYLSLFLVTIAHVFPIRVAAKCRLEIESFWRVYHPYAKYVFGLWTYFEPFLVDNSRKESLLLYLRAPLFPDPHFHFVESRGRDL